jgi:hypothetical protein
VPHGCIRRAERRAIVRWTQWGGGPARCEGLRRRAPEVVPHVRWFVSQPRTDSANKFRNSASISDVDVDATILAVGLRGLLSAIIIQP